MEGVRRRQVTICRTRIGERRRGFFASGAHDKRLIYGAKDGAGREQTAGNLVALHQHTLWTGAQPGCRMKFTVSEL